MTRRHPARGLTAVNDGAGHEVGDRVLRELADTWQVVVRRGDLVARLGGDEFGLLAPGSDEAETRQLVKCLAASLPSTVSASVGVATWDGTESPSDLLRRTDHAMYEAKSRRRVSFRAS